MLTSLFGRCIGLSAVVCVLLLFFFPLAQGNFQSTHGPVTALRAKRSVTILLFTIVMAALQVFATPAQRVLAVGAHEAKRASDDSGFPDFSATICILRC